MAAFILLSLAGGDGLGKQLLEDPVRHPVQQRVERSTPGRGGHRVISIANAIRDAMSIRTVPAFATGSLVCGAIMMSAPRI
jgi:hypothetical protein